MDQTNYIYSNTDQVSVCQNRGRFCFLLGRGNISNILAELMFFSDPRHRLDNKKNQVYCNDEGGCTKIVNFMNQAEASSHLQQPISP